MKKETLFLVVKLSALKLFDRNIIRNLSKELYLDHKLILQVIYKEDKRFFYHQGIDFIRVFGALFVNVRKLKIKQGASTISQQLYDIKQQNLNLEYRRTRTIKRKFLQTLFALNYEKKFNKELILKEYLENIYMGYNIFGFRQASKFYFKKSSENLNREEILFLIKKIKYPNL